jgi:hypothetical protein
MILWSFADTLSVLTEEQTVGRQAHTIYTYQQDSKSKYRCRNTQLRRVHNLHTKQILLHVKQQTCLYLYIQNISVISVSVMWHHSMRARSSALQKLVKQRHNFDYDLRPKICSNESRISLHLPHIHNKISWFLHWISLTIKFLSIKSSKPFSMMSSPSRSEAYAKGPET